MRLKWIVGAFNTGLRGRKLGGFALSGGKGYNRIGSLLLLVRPILIPYR